MPLVKLCFRPKYASSLHAEFACLNNGASIPLLGFGTAGGTSHEENKAAISSAIEVGYRHFDTASLYDSEAALGEALSDAYKAGTIKREDVFVTTKAWCSELDDVLGAIKRSLSKLQLDYVDLYLIHWPLKFRKERAPLSVDDILPLDIKQTWQAMEDCVQLGLTKAIGVSNFSSKKIEEVLLNAKIPPAVNQVEMHPRWQQKRLRETCNKYNILVCAWSPMGAPKAQWGSLAVVNDPIIKEIAEKHGKSAAQVALRWGLEQGVGVLPKSYNRERMTENFDIFGWNLTQEDLEKIGQLKQQKNLSGPYLHDGSVYNNPELWDGDEESWLHLLYFPLLKFIIAYNRRILRRLGS